VESRAEVNQIKGAALAEFLSWYTRVHGRDRLRSLPESVLDALDLGERGSIVLASKWYPAPIIHELLESLVRDLSAAERQRIVSDGARAVMEATLRGVYRLLFRTMMTPARYAQHSQKLWDRYYSSGRMTKRMIAPEVHATEISDWAGHHPLLCDIHVESARYIYAAMGCKNVDVRRTTCTSNGAQTCSFEVRWR
jgi:hypothetical protein